MYVCVGVYVGVVWLWVWLWVWVWVRVRVWGCGCGRVVRVRSGLAQCSRWAENVMFYDAPQV